jgi:hypothetical protein
MRHVKNLERPCCKGMVSRDRVFLSKESCPAGGKNGKGQGARLR